MSYVSGNEAEANAKLLIKLMKDFEAKAIGSAANFFEVPEDWICPSCHRSKPEQARLDKNRELMCAIHRHHDHLGDLAQEKIPYIRTSSLAWRDTRGYDSLRHNFRRFPDTLICNDCNVVEGDAKKKAGTMAEFSFTPFEISTFIIVTNNAKHGIDQDKLMETWSHVQPSLKMYGTNLREIVRASSDDTFQPIGNAAWRVLQDVRKKMKKPE